MAIRREKPLKLIKTHLKWFERWLENAIKRQRRSRVSMCLIDLHARPVHSSSVRIPKVESPHSPKLADFRCSQRRYQFSNATNRDLMVPSLSILWHSSSAHNIAFTWPSQGILLTIWPHPPVVRFLSITNEVRKLAKNHENLVIRLINFRFLKTWENFQTFVGNSRCLKKIRLPYWKCLGGIEKQSSPRTLLTGFRER